MMVRVLPFNRSSSISPIQILNPSRSKYLPGLGCPGSSPASKKFGPRYSHKTMPSPSGACPPEYVSDVTKPRDSIAPANEERALRKNRSADSDRVKIVSQSWFAGMCQLDKTQPPISRRFIVPHPSELVGSSPTLLRLTMARVSHGLRLPSNTARTRVFSAS